MSLTTNGSKASAQHIQQAATHARNRVHSALALAPACDSPARATLRASEQARKIIEECQCHQQGQEAQPDARAALENAVGNGTAFENFDEIIQQVSAIQ